MLSIQASLQEPGVSRPACGQAAAAKYPKRFRFMGWFVPKLPEQYKLLPRWLEQPAMCSLRAGTKGLGLDGF